VGHTPRSAGGLSGDGYVAGDGRYRCAGSGAAGHEHQQDHCRDHSQAHAKPLGLGQQEEQEQRENQGHDLPH